MLPIEQQRRPDVPWPASFRRVTACRAMRVTEESRGQIVAWCGGVPFGRGVRFPDGIGGEEFANLGDWVMQTGPGRFVSLTDAAFRAEWIEVAP